MSDTVDSILNFNEMDHGAGDAAAAQQRSNFMDILEVRTHEISPQPSTLSICGILMGRAMMERAVKFLINIV